MGSLNVQDPLHLIGSCLGCGPFREGNILPPWATNILGLTFEYSTDPPATHEPLSGHEAEAPYEQLSSAEQVWQQQLMSQLNALQQELGSLQASQQPLSDLQPLHCEALSLAPKHPSLASCPRVVLGHLPEVVDSRKKEKCKASVLDCDDADSSGSKASNMDAMDIVIREDQSTSLVEVFGEPSD
ncbi:hypothetical protein FISHEDRAFT_74851 [Fistulina hepatica ATCC 64428]|uniref:Uncharacterized protein n=1 Tax=Fistulina hepatica ATCC 64428 TaxID=1128425 RepID=A0A0D7ABB6_9AGAR|nr:hypothetical protein FISHEDRAFT_74851 [Fistulina hepatica ATCC 64428]